MIETLLQDVRYGRASAAQAPGFTAAAALTLAWASLRTPRYSASSMPCCCALCRTPHPSSSSALPERIKRRVRGERRRCGRWTVAAFADGHSFNMIGVGEPVRLPGTRVSAELFSVLGVRPRSGEPSIRARTLPAGIWCDSEPRAVAATFRQRRAVIGRSIELRRCPAADCRRHAGGFPFPIVEVAVWIPLDHDSRDNRELVGW